MSDLLTVWTDQGIVDMVAVSRFVKGDKTIKLTEVEVAIAYQVCKAGLGPVNDLATRAGVNATRLRKAPAPVIRRGPQRITLIPTRKVG